MDGFEILIPLAPFLMVAAIVIIPRWMKARERAEMQQTVRAAIDKGQPLPPELVEAMSKDTRVPKSASSDLRQGVIWLAVGIGIAAFSLANVVGFGERYGGHWEAGPPLLGLAAIPACIGIAFIVLSLFNKNKD